jgi:hypothetical protein
MFGSAKASKNRPGQDSSQDASSARTNRMFGDLGWGSLLYSPSKKRPLSMGCEAYG